MIGYLGFAAIAVFNVVAASAQKPVIDTFMYSDHGGAPAMAPEMVAKAAAVVVAEYTGESRLIDNGFAPPRTAYTFRVIETIKRHGALALDGDNMEVELPGGEIERATHIERLHVRGSRSIQKNHAYIIFFAWNLIQNKLYTAWGPSLYDLTGGYVSPVDEGSSGQAGKAASAFLAELRTSKK